MLDVGLSGEHMQWKAGRLEGVQCLFMREPNWNWMGKGTGWRARSDFVD